MKEIKLTKDQVTIVDNEDFEELNQYKWYAKLDKKSNSYRAVRSSLKPDNHYSHTIIMSRVIMKTPVDQVCDHADRNTLNNQKYNLRNCSICNNSSNKVMKNNLTSKYKGVCYNRFVKKWQSCISANHKEYYLGIFESELRAALVYDYMAMKLFKEFACLNFPNNCFKINYEYKESKPQKSIFRGVTWIEERQKWVARLYINKIKYYSDYLDSEEDAAYAYDFLCLQHFGPECVKFNMNGAF